MVNHISAFTKHQLQKIIASAIFPSDRSDWYINNGYSNEINQKLNWHSPFESFIQAQRQKDGEFYKIFSGLDLEQSFIDSKMANGKSVQIETVTVGFNSAQLKKLDSANHPGKAKHIIYFTGIGSCYQSCFEDIAQNVKTTGATVHAFNYPGLKMHGGTILEARDLINSGIAMVNYLIKQGVEVDDIVLQGDSFGAAVAYEVKKQFEEQSQIKLRCIMNNTFDTFEAAVKEAISKSWLPNLLKIGVQPLLELTGWNIRPGDSYQGDGPYQCHLQHVGDLTLASATLAGRVLAHQQTESYPTPLSGLSKKQGSDLNWARIKLNLIADLQKKYGVSSATELDAHMADICQLELLDGRDVYQHFINDFLKNSQAYIDNNRQNISPQSLPKFLKEHDSQLKDAVVTTSNSFFNEKKNLESTHTQNNLTY